MKKKNVEIFTSIKNTQERKDVKDNLKPKMIQWMK